MTNAHATVPFRSLIKAVFAVSAVPMMVMAVFVLFGAFELLHFLYAYFFILIVSVFFVRPYLVSIAALSAYVNRLAEDKKVEAPDFSMLAAVEELSGAVHKLHRTWEKKRRDMQQIITEREILVDTLPDILIMTDDQQNILRTNRAARSIFGQNLAYRALGSVINHPALVDTVADVVENHQAQQAEFYLPLPVDRHFRAIVERYPVPSTSGISTIVTLNDITELRRSEQMRADFVANASHEIRTPLASIIGFIETLRGPAKDDVAAHEQFLTIMADQAERMRRLVQDLLSLSKIEMNAHTEPTEPVHMGEIIAGEVRNLEWAAREKRMELKFSAQGMALPELPLVKGDEGELTQVIHNLVSNAIKYGRPDSDVTISAKITSKLPPDPVFRNIYQALCISVRDQGEGIAREHIPRLTERFYRVDSARTRSVGGTGLGLSIVKHILTRHRGALTIDSVQGEGSVFSVYLPLHKTMDTALAA